jgi:hypothetical protein
MNLREHWKDGGGPMRVRDQHYFTLGEDGEPVPVPGDDIREWAQWFESADRKIAHEDLPDDVAVSTVFLGINHNYTGGAPVLFETMIFGGPWDQYQWRYTLRTEAERGHAAIVAKLQAGEKPEP